MDSDSKTFNYESEEWEAIAACARKVRPGRKELTARERRTLLEAAIDYKTELEYRQDPDLRSPIDVARDWGRVAASVKKVREIVANQQKHECAIRKLPSLAGLGFLGTEAKEPLRICHPDDWGQVQPLLEAWEYDAMMKSRQTNGRLIINHFTFGRRERDRLKNVYYRAILKVWVDMIGGTLGHSTSSKNKVSGPSPRFIRAVTVPVMGEDAAPKLETIPGILKREERMRRRDTKFADSFGLKREECNLLVGSGVKGWYEVSDTSE